MTSSEFDEVICVDRCVVCGQANASQHYGVLACDGCKAFFRRTVRMQLQYVCRRVGSCTVDDKQRNMCRSCRFTACINQGMDVNAVQKPRDKISRQRDKRQDFQISSGPRNSVDSTTPVAMVTTHSPPVHSIELLTPSLGVLSNQQTPQELMYKLMHDNEFFARISPDELARFVEKNFNPFVSAIGQIITRHAEASQNTAFQLNSLTLAPANLEDCFNCIKEETLCRIALVKQHSSFQALPLKDRVAMFRANVMVSAIMSAIKRSLPFHNLVVLFNEKQVVRREDVHGLSVIPGISHAVCTILDDIVKPYRELEVDSIESCCLQVIAFWSPEPCSMEVKDIVKKRQLCFLMLLEKYINAKPLKTPARFGSLLVLLKTIQCVAQKNRDLLRMSRLFDAVEPDHLLDDVFKDLHEPFGPLGEQFSNSNASEIHQQSTQRNTTGQTNGYLSTQETTSTSTAYEPHSLGTIKHQEHIKHLEGLADWALWNL